MTGVDKDSRMLREKKSRRFDLPPLSTKESEVDARRIVRKHTMELAERYRIIFSQEDEEADREVQSDRNA